jgi:hypothetical protein
MSDRKKGPPHREMIISPRALQLFRQILHCNTSSQSDTDKRLRLGTELGLELKLETWEFFYGRERWPVKYIDDSALRPQLQKILDVVVNRYPPNL